MLSIRSVQKEANPIGQQPRLSCLSHSGPVPSALLTYYGPWDTLVSYYEGSKYDIRLFTYVLYRYAWQQNYFLAKFVSNSKYNGEFLDVWQFDYEVYCDNIKRDNRSNNRVQRTESCITLNLINLIFRAVFKVVT